MFKQLNPEAQECLPHTFPSDNCYQKPHLPALPAPRFFPVQSPWYFQEFGARWLIPTVTGRVSRYNAHLQPQPHGVKPHFPIIQFADEAATADKFGSGKKKLTARGRGESYWGKSLFRGKVHGAVWVPKKRKSGVEVVGDCIRSPPCPTLEDGVPLAGKTTVMIRNIPNQFRRHMLMEFLDNLCMDQNHKSNQLGSNPPLFEYDFLYLPMDFRRNNNYGYAFVNFTSAMAANMVSEILCDYKWGAFKDVNGGTVHSRKVCEITWARSQGKAEMVERFRNSHFMCSDSEYLPVVFRPPRDGANPAASSVTVVGRCMPPQ
ncbi:protein terminal ear1 homolog [Rhododendron vialii]|uniref:protein terminal ear1 homolog n=1 Tax=Rhododendron vialii TaxID=182163 RepID=UPI00265F8C10|nr:protein terminal ear1 homolog [Rhododendron vialii]